MIKLNLNFVKLLSFIFFSSFIAIGCDNPVHDDGDHADAVGFIIEQNNEEIIRFENNEYIYNQDGVGEDYFRDYNGTTYFTLSPDVVELSGDSPGGRTPNMVIRWIDADGDIFDHEENDEEYSLDFVWNKPADDEYCTRQEREALTEADDEIRPANIEQQGSWAFSFRADHIGEAEITWTLNHGDHGDFTSTAMRTVVADDEHEMVQNGQYLHEEDRCRVR